MGGYGAAYLGWQIRVGTDPEVIKTAQDMHPKLAGGMALFFALGAVGGMMSMIMQASPRDPLFILILALFLPEPGNLVYEDCPPGLLCSATHRTHSAIGYLPQQASCWSCISRAMWPAQVTLTSSQPRTHKKATHCPHSTHARTLCLPAFQCIRGRLLF